MTTAHDVPSVEYVKDDIIFDRSGCHRSHDSNRTFEISALPRMAKRRDGGRWPKTM